MTTQTLKTIVRVKRKSQKLNKNFKDFMFKMKTKKEHFLMDRYYMHFYDYVDLYRDMKFNEHIQDLMVENNLKCTNENIELMKRQVHKMRQSGQLNEFYSKNKEA
jgi:hypothetical protein